MGRLVDELREADCIHDGNHSGTTTTARDGTHHSEVVCGTCNSKLYTWVYPGSTRKPLDPVYKILYTNQGRLQLLIELLESSGIPIPELWSDSKSA